jgi:hypothetical protein
MHIKSKRRVTGPLLGVVIGVIGTVVASIPSPYVVANLPDAVVLPLTIVSLPFVYPAAMVTWFLIVGDNWQPSDYYRYVLPISLAINVLAGGLLGWGWRAWRQRRARKA